MIERVHCLARARCQNPEFELFSFSHLKQISLIVAQIFKLNCLQPGPDYCSDRAISFHKVSAIQMKLMEYLVYRLRYISVVYMNTVHFIADLMPKKMKT